eukprot:COSAG06_NODE_9590_length_1863_cov_282.975624_2_plen_225_part_01
MASRSAPLLAAIVAGLAGASPARHVDRASDRSSGPLELHHAGRDASVWRRTNCGSPASMNATHKVDIISTWGRTVTPANVKTLFEYPRPQMVRGAGKGGSPSSSWLSLNGLWEFEPCPDWGCGPPPFGRSLNETILVPFPVESCLSGLRNKSNNLNVPPTYTRMHYRTTFTTTTTTTTSSSSASSGSQPRNGGSSSSSSGGGGGGGGSGGGGGGGGGGGSSRRPF